MGEREVRRIEASGGFPLAYYPWVTDWLAELDASARDAAAAEASAQKAARAADSAAIASQAEATWALARHARNANKVAMTALASAAISMIISVLGRLFPRGREPQAAPPAAHRACA